MGGGAIKIGFLQLIGCSGCLTSIVDSTAFRDLWNKGYVSFFPMLKDDRNISGCDVVFVEGAASKKDRALLERVRAEAKKIISVGSCACFGGISSNVKELGLEPVHSVVKDDLELPGCPPPENLISTLLYTLTTGREFKYKIANLCSECPFHPCKAKYPIVIRELSPKERHEKCLLEEGVLCLGPITRAGCEARCIVWGWSCYGCMGLIKPISLIDFLALLVIPKELKHSVTNLLNLYGEVEYVS
jgi:coenzyme F420-reducing hydrogenase gamma subunit